MAPCRRRLTARAEGARAAEPAMDESNRTEFVSPVNPPVMRRVHYDGSMNRPRRPSRRTRLRLSIRRVIVAFLLLVLVLAVAVVLLTRTAPTWYEPPDPADAQVVELADKVEFRLLEEFQKIRSEPEPWKLRVRQEHINAWLATKLRDWIDSQPDMHWPENLALPQVRFEPTGISFAISVDSLGPSTVLVTRIEPRFEGEELLVTVDRFSMGRLNVPGEPVKRIGNLIDEYAADLASDEPAAQLLLRMLRGDERIDPVLDLADSRRVRLTNLELDHGSIVLTARTLGDDEE